MRTSLPEKRQFSHVALGVRGTARRISACAHLASNACALTRLPTRLTGRSSPAGRLLLTTLIATLAISAFFTASVSGMVQLRRSRPGCRKRDAINGLGDMAQSTTLFDASDKPAFTIFKEQRIELPLEKMSPNLIKAVISVEDQRFYRARRRGRDPGRRRRWSATSKRAGAPKAAARSRSSSHGRAS